VENGSIDLQLLMTDVQQFGCCFAA
jgi:hypothetical protein